MTSTMRSQPDAETRRRVEEMVRGIPGRSDELAFDEPWEIRAFALVLAMHASGQYPWSEFQQALIASIRGWEGSVDEGRAERERPWSYYEHWVNAFEAVLRHRGADLGAVDVRTKEVLDSLPNRNHHEPHYEPVAVDPAILS